MGDGSGSIGSLSALASTAAGGKSVRGLPDSEWVDMLAERRVSGDASDRPPGCELGLRETEMLSAPSE